MPRLTKKMKQELRTGNFDNNEYLLNAADAAEMLSCSPAFIYRLADLGKIKCVRWYGFNDDGSLGKRFLRFKREDILQFIKDHEQ